MHGAASRLRRGGLQTTLIAAVLITALTSCDTDPDSGGRNGNPDLSAPSASSGTTSVETEREVIVADYEEFWVRLRYVEDKAESTWDRYLAEVAVDPQLKLSLQATRFQKQNGIALYGEVRSRISDVKVDGDKATIVDCQDASESGQADATTGKKKTVGVPRNPVRARLELDHDQWKVAKITYPGGDC